MGGAADRLAAAGLALPAPPSALGSYVPATRAGGIVMTAGQLPLRDGVLLTSGVVGTEVSLETAARCARQAAVNALAAAATVCDLDSVAGVLRLTVYVASSCGFTSQSAVADGASEVLTLAFGVAGRHAREAVGVPRLPLDSPVEVSLVLSVE